MYATRDGHIEIVRLLCEEYKAKIDVVDQVLSIGRCILF